MPLNITNVTIIAMVPKENMLKNFQTKKSKIVIVTFAQLQEDMAIIHNNKVLNEMRKRIQDRRVH